MKINKAVIKGFLLAGVILILNYLRNVNGIHSMEDLELYINGLGSAPMIGLCILCVTVIASLSGMPISMFKAFGAVTFGFMYGWIFAYLAALISATVSFALSRFLASEGADTLYRRMIRKRLPPSMEGWLKGRGTLDLGYVFLLRNIYFVPFTPVNYLLGISKIPFKTYFLGTALGMIPGTTLYVYFFSRGFAFRDDPGAFLPVFAFALLYYNVIYLWRKHSLPEVTAKA